VRHGSIPDEVLAEAYARQVDLIIVGAHQPSLVSRLLGSNATAIVRDSRLDVLVVKHSGHSSG